MACFLDFFCFLFKVTRGASSTPALWIPFQPRSPARHSAFSPLFSFSFYSFSPLVTFTTAPSEHQCHPSCFFLCSQHLEESQRLPVKSQQVGCHSGLVQNPGHGNLRESFTRPRIHWDMQVGGDFPTSVRGATRIQGGRDKDLQECPLSSFPLKHI